MRSTQRRSQPASLEEMAFLTLVSKIYIHAYACGAFQVFFPWLFVSHVPDHT